MRKISQQKKILKFPSIGMIIFGISIAFTCVCSTLPNARDRGLKLMQEGRIEEAIEHYDQIIALSPEQPVLYYSRGLARQKIEDLEGALEDYTTAIRLNDEYVSAHSNRGLVRYWMADYEGALEDYSRVIELDPGNAAAFDMRGRIMTDMGDYEDALREFTSALQADPDLLSALSNRAYLHHYMEDFRAALEDYTRLLQKAGSSPQAYNNRGSVKIKIDDIPGAVSDFDKAIALDPAYGRAYFNRGAVWMKLKDYHRAVQDFEKAAGLDMDLKSEAQAHLKNCREKMAIVPDDYWTVPEEEAIQSTQIQDQAEAVNIEVPVRVYKNSTFVDSLTIDDFEVTENGLPQKIEAVYLIQKSNILYKNEELGSFAPNVATRHFVLFFEVVEYMPEIGDSLDYFLTHIMQPRDTLLVITPYKSYKLSARAWDGIPKKQVTAQLKELIRKDSWQGSAEYRGLLEQYQDLMHPYLPHQEDFRYQAMLDIVRKFQRLKQFDEAKAEAFAEYLKDKKGQKHVFLFYQKEMFPAPPEETGQETKEILTIKSHAPLDTERIKRIFADRSISCHFLYITRRSNDNSSKPFYQRSDWYDLSSGTFQGMTALAEATGGLAESSYNGREAFKKATEASENYYLLYYSPSDYHPDGKFREIDVKVKGRGFRVLHRAGYIAD
ncbi:tetratricopeptide repeat protein [Acidobacteriota bacterium]